MIVVLLTNPQTQQVQMTWEGGDHGQVMQALMTAAMSLKGQMEQQAAESTGQPPPPAARPSGLIIPSTAVPKDIHHNGAAQ